MSAFVTASIAGAALLSAIGHLWWRGTVNVSKAHRLVERGARLIDVDSPEIFGTGHLEGSVNIPVEDLTRRQQDVGPVARSIVVYARSGRTSARAAHLLRTIGYHSVLNLGLVKRWTA